MPTLYLLRHSEPAVRGVLLGQSDSPLSEAGRETRISLPAVERVYASPLLRARQTAGSHELRYEVVEGLREITYGPWDGKTWDEIERSWPDVAHRKTLDWFGVTPPGGEPWSHFQHRVIAALESILASPLPALIIAHEAVHGVIAAKLSGESPLHFKQGYCELVELSIT